MDKMIACLDSTIKLVGKHPLILSIHMHSLT